MRILHKNSYNDDSDEEPETDDVVCEAQDDDDNRGMLAGGNQTVNFIRSVRRDEMIDCRDDDGFWYPAQVKKIGAQSNSFFVSFPNTANQFDKWIRSYERVAPLYTRTYDNRGGCFRPGQYVEVLLEDIDSWRGAVIQQVEPNRVLVSYIVRESMGSHSDLHNRQEWISSPHNRIRSLRRILENKSSSLRDRNRIRRWRVPGRDNDGDPVPGSIYCNDSRFDNTRSFGVEGNEDSSNYSNPTSCSIGRVRTISARSDRFTHYLSALRQQGLSVVEVVGDGNCLFRAVAHQVYGAEDAHAIVRGCCIDYMEANGGFFCQFVEGGAEAFPQYLAAKRLQGCWGDDPEIQALCEIYDRPAEIWAYDSRVGAKKLRTFHEAAASSSQHHTMLSTSSKASGAAVMKLSYYGGGHYDSVISTDHARHLLHTSPGVCEYAAVGRSSALGLNRERATQTAGSAFGPSRNEEHNFSSFEVSDAVAVELSKAVASSDVDATDRDALDLAIQISRTNHSDWASEDLDACLLLALEDEETASEKGKRPTSSSSSSSNNNNGRNVEAVVDSATDLLAAHRDELASVAALSEREYIDRAIMTMAGSGYDAHKVGAADHERAVLGVATLGQTEEEQLEQARIASLRDLDSRQKREESEQMERRQLEEALTLSQRDEAETLKRVLESSVKDFKDFSSAARISPGQQEGGKWGFASYDDNDEDTMLQAALQESLLSSSFPQAEPKGVTETLLSDKHKDTANSNFEDDDEEYLLNQAIAESLSHSFK